MTPTPAPHPDTSAAPPTPHRKGERVWRTLGVGLAVMGLIAFLRLTPGGLLTKADYVGAAVCHRLPSHSFFIAGRQLPLCQRCTGTFTGALTGVLVQWGLWRRRRAQQFPHWSRLLAVAGLALPWALDGLNSYTTFFTGGPEGWLGYAPIPWLRLLSGLWMGMGMSLLLVPAFNLAMWRDGERTPTLRRWGELIALIILETALAGLIYLRRPWLLYPVALYSTLGVVVMFILLGAMLFTMAVGWEMSFTGWREAWPPLVWGLVFALTIVGGMDLLRVHLIGQITGMPGL